MKRIFIVTVAVFCLCCASGAFAETNGQTQANNDIVRSSGQALSTMVQGRVATIAAPKPAGLRTVSANTLDEKGNFKFAMNAEDLGLASGDDANNFGVWGMGSFANFKSTASGAKYDADAYNFLAGFDWRATPELLIGIAGGFGTLDLDKDNWAGDDNGTIKTDSEWTVMPYLAYNFTDTTILDAAFAYTASDYKDSNSTDSGSYDSTRYLTNVGLSQYYLVDDWTFSGRMGFMYVHGDLSSYSRGSGATVANPDSYLGQLSLEGKAAYFFSNGLEPYAGLRYYYDAITSSIPVNSDYDEFEGILGANWYASDQWTINLEGGATMGRDKYEAYRGQATIRFEF